MAASKVLETKKPPVTGLAGLVRIENAHMAARMMPNEKVVLEKFGHLYPAEVSNCTGREFARKYPQSVSEGREATYFIPNRGVSKVYGKLFSYEKRLVSGIRQALSPSKDLHNRVYLNETHPGGMNDAWDLQEKRKAAEASYASKAARKKTEGRNAK